MSVAWIVRDEVGALGKVCNVVSKEGLNMEAITSIQFGGMNQFIFYAEIDAPMEKKKQNQVLKEIASVTEISVCLGIFPKDITLKGL